MRSTEQSFGVLRLLDQSSFKCAWDSRSWKAALALTVSTYSLVRGPLRSHGTHQYDASRHVVEGDLFVCWNRGCRPTRPRAHERTAGGLQSACRGEAVITSGFEHTRPRLCVRHGFQEGYSGVVGELRSKSTIKLHQSGWRQTEGWFRSKYSSL